jgi:hypothetical protein
MGGTVVVGAIGSETSKALLKIYFLPFTCFLSAKQKLVDYSHTYKLIIGGTNTCSNTVYCVTDVVHYLGSLRDVDTILERARFGGGEREGGGGGVGEEGGVGQWADLATHTLCLLAGHYLNLPKTKNKTTFLLQTTKTNCVQCTPQQNQHFVSW